ncbi:hypothetical protein CPTD_01347 [Corynebacterium pseudotuberculosis]|nr:Hypothetical protein Cp3995_1201 [Corynebacterium pseudotuberculosis 3/99-5]AIG07579.1 hypothetical protein CPTA_01750 [Corynebacterium pseudotuberculosis]AIG10069.1 hypothetical protein CPTB_02013 [Corynebacterium pseudotuberculosis]AIG12029.1 hypothetical protein CPTC_01741 [Corynebacterium pseudotuberculosis]AKC73940.1 Hypothetical protein Cp226_1219 [Corynebacterium pseudotuberculosis]
MPRLFVCITQQKITTYKKVMQSRSIILRANNPHKARLLLYF